MRSNVTNLKQTITTFATTDAEFKDGDEDYRCMSKLEIYLEDEHVEKIIAEIRSRVPTAIIFASDVFDS